MTRGSISANVCFLFPLIATRLRTSDIAASRGHAKKARWQISPCDQLRARWRTRLFVQPSAPLHGLPNVQSYMPAHTTRLQQGFAIRRNGVKRLIYVAKMLDRQCRRWVRHLTDRSYGVISSTTKPFGGRTRRTLSLALTYLSPSSPFMPATAWGSPCRSCV